MTPFLRTPFQWQAFGRLIYLRRKQELTAAGRSVTLWPLALRADGAAAAAAAAAAREAAGPAGAAAGGAASTAQGVNGVGLWDSSDVQDASLNPILLPAESDLY